MRPQVNVQWNPNEDEMNLPNEVTAAIAQVAARDAEDARMGVRRAPYRLNAGPPTYMLMRVGSPMPNVRSHDYQVWRILNPEAAARAEAGH